MLASYDEFFIEEYLHDYSEEELAELDETENLEDWDGKGVEAFVSENIYELNETEFFELINVNI